MSSDKKMCKTSVSIVQKVFMGVSGLALCGFVFMHMAGNMLLLVSPELYNKYGHGITSNPAYPLAAGAIVLFVLTHVVFGIRVTIRNKLAKKTRYAVSAKGEKAASLASKTMAPQGMIVLAFLILHLATIKFGAHYPVNYAGIEMRDLYKLVFERFQDPLYSGFYILALVILATHLSHGFSSAFQSLGLHHPSYTPKIQLIGKLFAAIVTLGFISQPVVLFMKAKGM